MHGMYAPHKTILEPYTADEQETALVDVLLCNPTKALELIFDTKKGAIEMGKILESTQPETAFFGQKLHQKCEQICPIYLLGECTSLLCPFNRHINPTWRATYEKSVSSLFREKIEQNPETIIHTAHFSRGNCAFSDLIILTQALAQKPNAQVHMNFIDQQYSKLVNIRDTFNETHEIKRNESNDPEAIKEAYLQYIQSLKEQHFNILHPSDDGDTPIERMRRKMLVELITILVSGEKQHKQFLQWLHDTFPLANISLSVHSSTENYLDYVKRTHAPYPDIVTAIDIQGRTFQDEGTMPYIRLCKKAALENPTSANLWLADDFKGSIGLVTCSLEEPAHRFQKLTSRQDGISIYLSMIAKVGSLVR